MALVEALEALQMEDVVVQHAQQMGGRLGAGVRTPQMRNAYFFHTPTVVFASSLLELTPLVSTHNLFGVVHCSTRGIALIEGIYFRF